MAYATVDDVQTRMARQMTASERNIATALLDDAAVVIDAYALSAPEDIKKVVSCRMVIRALGNGDIDVPVGATQGSLSALGYSQSWTMGSGANAELYLSKTDKLMLGGGNRIGSYSPVEGLVVRE